MDPTTFSLCPGRACDRGPWLIEETTRVRPVPKIQSNLRCICLYLKPCFLNFIHIPMGSFFFLPYPFATCTNIYLVFF